MKKYRSVERFDPQKVKAIYQRFEEKDGLLPVGVFYINSWIDESLETCYQLMESESLEVLQEWTSCWEGLADFEIIPVISSADAKKKVFQN